MAWLLRVCVRTDDDPEHDDHSRLLHLWDDAEDGREDKVSEDGDHQPPVCGVCVGLGLGLGLGCATVRTRACTDEAGHRSCLGRGARPYALGTYSTHADSRCVVPSGASYICPAPPVRTAPTQ